MTDNQKKLWDDLKAKHPEALLLFRCGDFYEAYCEDAKECAKILGITLMWRTPTMRHKPGDYSDAMAGFPHHALDVYLPRIIRAGHRVAICDWPTEPPKKKRGITETIETSETKSEETMAQNMKAADLIGKTVSIKGSDAKYVIKSVEGDKLMTDFYRAKDAQPMPCPLPWATLEAKMKEGVYIIAGASEECRVKSEESATASDDVEEVDDIKVEPAKTAKTVDMKPKKKDDKPKAKAKTSDVNPQPSALKYETYTTKKGKTGAKIVGFRETDAAYLAGPELHGAKWQETDKQGNKTYCLLFSHRYADAAKEVCKALNAGKSVKDCQAIIDQTTEERARQRDEWKQKREERRAAADAPKGKTYTEAEVADLLKRVVAGDKEAMEIVNAMAA